MAATTFKKNLLKVWDYVTSTACHVQYCLVFQLSIFGVVDGAKTIKGFWATKYQYQLTTTAGTI